MNDSSDNPQEQATRIEAATAATMSTPGLAPLSKMLEAIRSQLNMDVAFVSRFADGKRIFEHVNAIDDLGGAPLVGAADPLEATYCQRVVDGRAPDVIPDTSQEPSVRDLAVTEALNIRSYLSAPIVLSDGTVYGTLCCFSHRPQPALRSDDAAVLRTLADMVAAGVNSRGELLPNLWLGS